MKAKRILLISGTMLYSTAIAMPAMAMEIGGTYGREFLHNTDVEQYELFVRAPLPYQRQTESGWKIVSAVEIGAATIREKNSDNDSAGRFSVMPQIGLSPHQYINFIVGLGAGFMVGNTEFTDQNLGGEFLLASKVGLEFLLGEHFKIGYSYYHQSNAGVYEYNSSLNMHQLALSCSF
jgi:hypothetical protein